MVERFPTIIKPVKYTLTVVLVVFGVKTFQQSSKWSHNTKLLEEAHANSTNNKFLAIALANSKAESYHLDESLQLLEEVLSRDKDFNEAISTIIDLYTFRCDEERTFKILNILNDVRFPLPLKALMQKAFLHVGIGEMKEASVILSYLAINNFRMNEHTTKLMNSIKRKYEQSEANSYLTLGYFHLERKQYRKSLEYFEEGFKITDEPEKFIHWIYKLKEKLSEEK